MAYYGGYRRRSYRSWRSRGFRAGRGPSEYSRLHMKFGDVVGEIRSAFLALEDEALDELFGDYGAIHGDSAERYARKTFPSWKSGKTNLSGQTLTRLVELVPPYLSAEQRMKLVDILVATHKPRGGHDYNTISVNALEPAEGFAEIDKALSRMAVEDVLAHLPDFVMDAAKWLYDDDVTAARAVLAQATKAENDMKKAQARKDLELLKRTVGTGQVKTASYSVELPAGRLRVNVFTPSKGILGTIFGWFS